MQYSEFNSREALWGKGTSRVLYHFLLVALFSVASMGIVGCGDLEGDCSDDPTTAQFALCNADPSLTSNVFLSAAEFEGLRRGGAVVLDVRGEDTVKDGHIPGAVRASWRPFVYPDRNGIVKEEIEELEEQARLLGIRNDVPVIIYGDGGTSDSSAGRMFWTVEYLGHPNVALLDGGFDAWKELNLEIATGHPVEQPEGDFTVNLRREIRATVDEVEAAIENDELYLVDTRNVEEWLGDEEHLRGNPRGGYIPTAVHYHWEDVIDKDTGRLRSKDEIRAELEAIGIVPGVLTIPYCQTGVRSGYFYAVLKWLGYPNPKNYDGSWWEWSRDEDLPLGEYDSEE